MTEVMAVLNTIFWEVALISVALAVFQYVVRLKREKTLGHDEADAVSDQMSLAEDFNFSDRTYKILLGVTVLIGVLVRVWQFGAVPGGFNQDGAMAAVDAKAMADYLTDRFGTFMPVHLSAWGFSQMSSLLSYMMAIFIKLFGLNPITARAPQLVMSLLGGAFFYLFIRDLFGKGAGLIAAMFVAINPWHVLQSRWALDCNLLPHFFMGGLYFLNKGISQRRRYIFISMIFFAFCMYCYGITIYTIPVFLFATCFYYLARKRLTVKDSLISARIYLALAWPFLLTMAINFFKWSTISLPFATLQFFEGSIRANDILLFSSEPLKQLGENIQSLFNIAVLQKKDLAANDIEGFGTMFLFTMPFVAAGFIELFRHKTDGPKGLVLLAVLTGVWAGLLTNGVNINRVNIIFYGIMMLAVLGIYFVIREIKYLKWSSLFIYAVAGVLMIGTYFGSYNDTVKEQFFYGFGDAVLTAEESGAQKIYVTADIQAKDRGYVSEIMVMFYDQTDAEYYQGKKNENHGETMLPYKERFIYTSMSPEVVSESQGQDAAYVIMESDREFFDESVFEITPFGKYCAVVRK